MLGAMGYRGLVAEQNRARDLRAESWTLQEIADELGVAKSSVSLWVRDVEFVPKPRSAARRRRPTRSSAASRPRSTSSWPRAAGASAGCTEQEFLVAGTALYAGEGSKTDGEVCFANSDPRMILFFCAWLRRSSTSTSRSSASGSTSTRVSISTAAIAFWSALHRDPADAVRQAVPGGARSVDPDGEARARLPVGPLLRARRTHRAVMGLVQALLSCDDRPSGVAQLAERRTVNPIVVGSSPTPGAPTAPRPPIGRGVGSFFVGCRRVRACSSVVRAGDS